MVALLLRWARARRGDMVWNAIVIITVMLPLASLSIDIPRYFMLRSHLQKAANATSEAAARSVDVEKFRDTGKTVLDRDEALDEAMHAWGMNTGPLIAKDFGVSLDDIRVDEGNDIVTVEASGTTRLFFGISPEFTVHATALSRFRMDQR